jgi:hypothetical protein
MEGTASTSPDMEESTRLREEAVLRPIAPRRLSALSWLRESRMPPGRKNESTSSSSALPEAVEECCIAQRPAVFVQLCEDYFLQLCAMQTCWSNVRMEKGRKSTSELR